MTDEELQQTIQGLQEAIDKLSDSDEPLTKKEKRRERILLLQKEALVKVKEAREKNDKRQELANMTMYGLLESWGEKHPILLHIARAKLAINIDIF